MNLTSQNRPGVSIVVFERNAGIDLKLTLENLKNIQKQFSHIESEIIVVDDGSEVKPLFTSEERDIYRYLELGSNIGISGAIHEGAKLARFQMLLAVPGTNMYELDAYRNIFKEISLDVPLIIGVRTNLWKERPKIKFISSKVLLFAYRVVTKNFKVLDIHGLNAFATSDVLKDLPPDGGHGGQMQLLTHALSTHMDYVTVETPIRHLHKKRESATKKDSRPSLKGIYFAISGLKKCRKISRNPKLEPLIKDPGSP
jgi:hypothetical protein